jgi:hypothetical protein
LFTNGLQTNLTAPAWQQRPGDTVHLSFHRHPINLVKFVAAGILAVAALVWLLPDTGETINLFQLAGVLTSGGVILWAIWSMADYHQDRVVIYDDRITLAGGLITKYFASWPLASLLEIKCHIGLLGILLDYGRITMDTAQQTVQTVYAASLLGRILNYRSMTFSFTGGQDQALSQIAPVKSPVTIYKMLIELAEAQPAHAINQHQSQPGPT